MRDAICGEPDGSPVGALLCYHFGYDEATPPRRGKRLRPQLLYALADAGVRECDGATDASVAVELLHNYSLIHDDIEDADRLRHGRPTLWAVYGVPHAINAGDALCALSFLTIARSPYLSAPQRIALVETLHDAHLRMCAGQALDLQFELEALVGLPAYERMIDGKTAALFGAACEMGALCAEDRDPVQAREIGRRFGLAFQIRDDVLGIWGSTEATGKVAANDLARRKWTFPVAWALTEAPACAERQSVARAYAAREQLSAQQVTEVAEALEALGAREAANRAIAEHVASVERQAPDSVRALLANALDLSLP